MFSVSSLAFSHLDPLRALCTLVCGLSPLSLFLLLDSFLSSSTISTLYLAVTLTPDCLVSWVPPNRSCPSLSENEATSWETEDAPVKTERKAGLAWEPPSGQSAGQRTAAEDPVFQADLMAE